MTTDKVKNGKMTTKSVVNIVFFEMLGNSAEGDHKFMQSLIIQKISILIFRVAVVIRNEHFLGFLKCSPLKNPPQECIARS